MIKPVTFWQRSLVYVICWTFNIQPLLAHVIVDNSQHNTSVNHAGNGVEVVNIATPNANGLSHNQYQQFNVDPSGLILNNSTAQVAQSQLGGYLQNNPNLHGQAATVILNEVTGASRSQLQGYTEVFGQGANVILTNPYGITCNGCGFINTPRVTLSTGTPLIDNGNVTGFDVSQGSVSIEGLGLDATHQSYFDIITRTAQLNAEIHANDLSVVTGKNRVSYQSNQVTATTADDQDTAPELAIDSSNLGGMYAGRIALVATDAGVGVNVGNLSASQGEIQISADGQVTLGKSSAQTNLAVSSQSGVTLKGSQYAKQAVSVSGQTVHADSDILAAGQSVSLTAADAVTLNQSLVEAGVDADGNRLTGGIVNVQSHDLNINASNLIANQQLTTKVRHATVDQDSLMYGQEMTLNQLGKLDNRGTVAATHQLSVNGTEASLVGDGHLTASDITINSDRLTLDTHLTAQTLDVQARQALTTDEHSDVSAAEQLTVTAGTLNQQGKLTTRGDMNIDATAATLKGHVAAQNLHVKAQRLTQESGILQAGQALDISGGSVTLSGDSAANTSVGIQADQLTLNGTLQSGGETRLTVDGKMQTGDDSQLVTQGRLLATVDVLTQRGTMQSGEDVTLTGHTLNNEGDVSALGNTHLTAQAQLTNRGTVTSGQQLVIDGGAVTNSGELSAQQDTNVTVTGQLDNQANGLISGQVTTVQAKSVNNAGQLQALTDLGLTTDALNNRGTLAALSDATLTVTHHFTNRGTVSAAHDARLLTDNLTNSGHIVARDNLLIAKDTNQSRNTTFDNTDGSLNAESGNLTIATQGDLQVSAGQHLFAGKNLTLTAATLNNSAEITAQDNTRLILDGVTTAHAGLTNQTDALISGQTTSIDAQSVNNHGQLQALGNLGLTVSSLENSGTLTALNTTLSVSDHLLNTGAVSAVEHVSLLAAQVDNQGTVYAGAHLLVAADQQQNRSDSLNNAGRFETHNGDIEIVTDTVTQQQSGHIIAGHDLRLDGHQLDNGGELAATHHTDLTLDQHVLNRDTGLISGQATRLNAHAVNNQGQLQSLSDLGLTAESFENSGVLAGLANVTLHITHDLTSRGSVLAGNHIVLNAGRIDNQGRVSAGDQAIVTAKPSATGSDVGLTVTADTLTNSGQLLAQGNNQLTINADLTNQTGGLISGQATTVKARSVTNAGQLQSLSDLGLTANALANSGTLAALSDMTLNVANQLSNSGAISANHNASLLTDNLTNKGRVFAGNNLLIAKDTNQTRNTTFDNTDGSLNAKAGHLTIATHGDVMVSAGQHWMAEQDVTLHANSLTNDGEVSAQGETSLTLDNALTNHGLVSGQSTTVTAQSVTNTGQMQALTNLGLTTDALDNSGTFVAFNDVDLTVTDRLLNRGSGAVLAGENIKLSAALIDNQGRVSAGDGAIMTPEQRTAEQTESDLIVTADTLTNSGELLAQGNNQLTIKADLTNQTGGLISGQLTTVKAPSVTNLGQLQSLSALGLTADALDNSGTLAALSDMTLNVANQLSNSGAISANHNASLLTDNLTNKGRVFAGNNLLIAKDTNQTRNTTFNNTDGSLTAKAGQLTIATHGDVMVSAGQHWTAGQDVTLQANRLTNDGEVSAQGNTALTLDNALTNHGLVSGQNTTLVAQSVTNTGQLQSLSDLGLTADALDNSGTLVAFNDIDLTVTDRLLNRGSGAVLAGENIKLSAALIDNQGRVSAGDQAIMTPEQRTVEQTESDLIVTADALTNSGELLALGNNQLTINTDLTNQTGGLISGQATTVKAQSVTNAGQLQSLSDLGLTADALDNSGTLAALSDMTLNVVNRLSNSGAISANHNASLLTDNLINKGRVFAGNNLLIAKDTHQTRNTSFDNTDGSLTAKAGHLTVATHGDVSVSAGQHWMAGQDVTVYANSLINNGEVTAQGETSLTLDNAFTNHGLVSGQNTTVKSQSVSNTGQLQSLSALGLTADALDNSGTLAALSDITLNVANQLSNSGAISASHNASLLTDNLTNKGAVFAGHDLLIAKDSNQTRNTTFDNTDGSLTAKAGHLTIATHDDVSVSTGQHWVAGQNLTLQANSLTNDGEVSAQGNTSLTLNHALTNHGLVSGQKATITSQSVTNTGQLQSLSDLGLTADALDNSGTLAALNDMTLNIANQLSNSGAISANHDASLLTDNLTNHGTVLAGHDLLIAKDTHQTRNTTFDNTDGSLTAKAGQLTIATHGDVMVSAGQHWMAGQDVTVHADSLTNDGEVSAQGNTSLTLDNALTNHGLVSGQSTTIRAQSVTNIGQMQSLTDFGLTTDALNNSGTLVAFNDIDLTVTDRLLNRGSGAVLAGENIKLSAALIDNQGRVSAGDQAIMTPEQRTVEQTESDLIVTADTLTNSGELLAQGHNQLTINTDLTNQTGGLISGQATTVKAQSVTNLGQLQSLSALGLTADALDNSGTLAALSDMTLNVANQLSNSGAISANHNASLLTDNLTNKGRVFAGNNLLVAKDSNQTRNTTFDNTDGSLNAKAGHLTVATHGDVIVSAEQHWMAGQDVTVYANSLTNGGEVTAQGETSLTLDNAFTNHGLVSGQNTTVKSQSVSNTGQLQSLNDLGLTADALDNSGTLAALNDITLNVVNQLGNSGTVSADHDASLLTDNLSNHGRVFADNNLLIAKDTNQTRNTTFDNTDGSLTAKAGHLTIATHDDVSVSTGQHWVAGQNLTLQANSLTNDGEVSAQGNTSLTLNHALTNHGLVSGQKATITSQSVTNTGQLQSLSDLGLTADALDNSGTLAALNDMTLNVANQLSNSGAISANHDASLLTDNLSNHGRVFAGHDLLIAKDTHQTRNTTFNNTDGSLTAKAGHLIVATHGDVMVSAGQHWVAGQNLTLQANSLTNDGEVSAQGNTSLTLNDALTNHGLISGQSTTVTTHSVTNSGQLQSLSDLGLTTNALANSGTLAALSDITLNVVNQLSNSGAISANHDASLLTDHLTNKGRVFADNNLLIARDSAQTRNTTFDNTDGSLNAKAGHLTVATHDNVMVSAGQHWIAGQGLTLQANSLTNNGEVSTQGNTALALDNALTNHGLISGQSTTVTTQSVTNTGQLQALTDLGLNAGVLANSGALVAGRNAVFNIIHTLTSHGNISAGNNASLLADQVNNQNKIYAGNSVLIAKDSAQTRSSSLINSGQIDAKHGSITIATQGDFTVGAGQHISAGKDLTLVAAALTNDGELSSQGTTTIGVDGIGVDGTGVDGTGVDGTGVGGTLTNHTAGIISGQNTVLRAGTTTNQGQLQALNDLHLTTGSLTNTGSLVALNDMTVHATGHIDNHSLLYAGRNGNLFSDTLTNYSDIVVGNDLLIARDSNKTRSRNLTNSSGSIESLGGNIGIYADSVLNKRTVLDIVNQTQDLRGNIPGGGGDIVPADFDNIAVKRAYDSCSYCDKPGKKIFVNGKPHIIGESSDAPFALDVTIGSGGYSIGRNGPSIDYVYYYIIGGKTYSAVAYQESETLKNATPQGRIAAGNNLNIYADNLANESSLISGKNVAISVTHLLNQGHQFNRFITYFDYSLKPRRGGAWLWNVGGHSYKDDGLLSFSGIGNSRYSPDSFYLQGTRRVQVGSGSVLQSSITARDNLTLNVQNRTNNSVIGINAAGMQPTQSARTTRATQGPLGVQADVQTTQHTPGTGQGVTSTQDVSDSAQSLQTAQGGGIAQGVQATQGSSDTTPSLQTAQGGGTAQGIQVTQGPSDTTPSLQTAQGAGTAQSVQMTQGSSDTSGTTPSFQTAQGSGTAQSIQVTQGSSDTSGTVQSQSATTHRMQLTPLADDSGAALQSGQAQSDSGLAAQSTPNMTSMTRPVPQGGKSATTVTLSNSSAVTAPTVNLPNQNSIPFPDYRLPTSPHGLFVFSDGPQSDYLIATNPAVTNLNNFLGSDYFKDQLNYDPEQKEKFLGDAYYDTRTITQEIFEQTGKRYLSDDIGSDLAQMKQLIDSAAQQKNSLNLQNGVALTDEQIARLSHDIIWYEPIEVNGQTVMAPKLYLSSASQDNISNGALLAGGNVNIGTGDFANSGSVSARQDLNIASRGGISNTRGTLSANNDLALIATGDIVNQSGVIDGDNVALLSTSGSIINETLSDQLNIDDQGNKVSSNADNIRFTSTILDQTASIQSSGDLNLQAGGSYIGIGSRLSSGGDLNLSVANDILLTSQEDKTYSEYRDGKATIKKSEIGYLDNALSAGNDLNILTGGDMRATGGSLSAGNNVSLGIGGDLRLSANETYFLDSYDASRKKDIISRTRQQGVQIQAGNDLQLTTGGDATLVAAGLSAQNDLTVSSGGTLMAVAGDETDYERHYRKRKGFWGSSVSDTEIQNTRAKGTSFSAGGSVNITSQDNQLHQASVLNAGQDITLRSTHGVLALKSAEESSFYRHDETKSGFMVKVSGEGKTSTTQKLTSMSSGGKITLAGALGMEVDYVSTGNNLARTLDQLPANGEYAWVAQLKDNPNVDWHAVNEAFDQWSYSDSHLSGPAAAMIAIAVAVATAGSGAAAAAGNMAAGAAGSSAAAAGVSAATAASVASVASAMGSAAFTSLVTQASIALVSNQGNLGHTFHDLGSSGNMKSLATAVVTAGVMRGMDIAQYANSGSVMDQVTQQVSRTAVQSGVSSAIQGGSFSDNFANGLKQAAINYAGAKVADGIGDLGAGDVIDGVTLAEGGFTKALLHGLTQGGLAELSGGDFAAGAAGGVASEITADAIGHTGLNTEAQTQLSGLVGGIAGWIATGDESGISTGQSAGEGVYANNYLNHIDKMNALKEFKKCDGNDQCQEQVREKYKQISEENNAVAIQNCRRGDSDACQGHLSEIEAATSDSNQSFFDRELDYENAASHEYITNAAAQYGVQNNLSGGDITPKKASDLTDVALSTIAAMGTSGNGWRSKLKGSGSAVVKGKFAGQSSAQGVIEKAGDSSFAGNKLVKLDPQEISFSQATVAYQKKNSELNYDHLVQSMKENGWSGDPVDVVMMPDRAPTSADNTRILAAREANIKVEANLRNYDEPISPDQARRFKLNGQIPKTWGEAIEFRVKKQSQMPGVEQSWSEQFPYGSIYDPDITR